MAMQYTHDLVVKTGEYQHNGEKKNRYLNIGKMFRRDDGSLAIKIDAIPIGVPGWEGWVGVFEPKPRDGQQSAPRQAPAQQRQESPRGDAGGGMPFDDDIPFNSYMKGNEYAI